MGPSLKLIDSRIFVFKHYILLLYSIPLFDLVLFDSWEEGHFYTLTEKEVILGILGATISLLQLHNVLELMNWNLLKWPYLN